MVRRAFSFCQLILLSLSAEELIFSYKGQITDFSVTSEKVSLTKPMTENPLENSYPLWQEKICTPNKSLRKISDVNRDLLIELWLKHEVTIASTTTVINAKATTFSALNISPTYLQVDFKENCAILTAYKR